MEIVSKMTFIYLLILSIFPVIRCHGCLSGDENQQNLTHHDQHPTMLRDVQIDLSAQHTLLHSYDARRSYREYEVGSEYFDELLLEASDTPLPGSCKELKEKGTNVSGIYLIQPNKSLPAFRVLCDMKIRKGGWTHIQKRFDGHEEFFRDYRNYKFGFGYLNREFWLGLESIYLLTGHKATELLVELVDKDGLTIYAYYESFAIGPEVEGYNLKLLSGYDGDAGDSLKSHLGMKFSTFDLDRDTTTANCANVYKGGWWYAQCIKGCLNGKFVNAELPRAYNYQCITWDTYKVANCFSKSRMLVR